MNDGRKSAIAGFSSNHLAALGRLIFFISQ